MLTFLLSDTTVTDQEFFNDIYDKYHAIMYSYALSFLTDPHDAEDAIQQVFLNIWKYIHAVKRISSDRLKSYLLKTTQNHCYTVLSRKLKKPIETSDIDLDLMESPVKDPERALMDQFDRALLKDAMDDIAITYRQIILDKVILHLSDTQIAEHLGIKKTYVRECLSRARASLRQKYNIRLENSDKNAKK